ncbi:hypothetical protein J3998_12380 [Thiomicrorhabdus sp. 6S2-11]|uniref:Lipoprotein n=1 Tax=Thiomicrorhabdus marina TaxID=2818442 RepID=A0ABS3Q7N1_9GAMM|nr:hypothetical protein [Thiomicrorhabdus marina]MBO1928370.1 hypothetical protein [Thiomicrorhabdus marina]
MKNLILILSILFLLSGCSLSEDDEGIRKTECQLKTQKALDAHQIKQNNQLELNEQYIKSLKNRITVFEKNGEYNDRLLAEFLYCDKVNWLGQWITLCNKSRVQQGREIAKSHFAPIPNRLLNLWINFSIRVAFIIIAIFSIALIAYTWLPSVALKIRQLMTLKEQILIYDMVFMDYEQKLETNRNEREILHSHIKSLRNQKKQLQGVNKQLTEDITSKKLEEKELNEFSDF